MSPKMLRLFREEYNGNARLCHVSPLRKPYANRSGISVLALVEANLSLRYDPSVNRNRTMS